MAKAPKKWKWNEYAEWKEQAEQPEPEPTNRSGTCPKCGNGSFTLTIQAGRMNRHCKNTKCGDVVTDV